MLLLLSIFAAVLVRRCLYVSEISRVIPRYLEWGLVFSSWPPESDLG
ncbi:unnamed protein product [Callosobruchus maculatus]|uniref:Uncharacterized protein n=1 Tax=Callosobruchus maculatus TaxID=64391 RepID=A0A653D1A3_CALMS|nr:unnamed protein product [Callosobruchus maculatus]